VSEDVEIVLFEKGEYISYANCGLPYYIGGTIANRNKLFVQTAAAFGRRFNIDVRTRSEVTAIDRAAKKVTVRKADGSTYEESFDKLLLSPGSSPVRPPFPGIDIEGIFTLRNVEDTDQIYNYMQAKQPKEAVVIGGGFIGLEMAENLTERGCHVNIVEMLDQVMAPIDYSMASFVHTHLQQKGVGLYLKRAVESFSQEDGRIKVHLKDGAFIMTDMVLLSIGVKPASGLAKAAGITLGERGGIVVNDYLQTEDENIYAVGDAIEFRHPVTGKPWHNYLAGPANRQARIVADNMLLGNTLQYEGAIGTSIAKIFDLTVAATGLAAKRLKADGVPYECAVIHPNSCAGYYPTARPLTLKIVFDKATGRLYGAQAVGTQGIDKRIDEIALVIKHNGTIYDLQRIEQAYAPPYSSAKDPVALAGYVAENICKERMFPLYWRELANGKPEDVFLLDVRTPDEYGLGSLPDAVNIPLDDLRQRIDEVPQDRPIWVFCAVGLRGYLASNILLHSGFKNVRNLIGGLKLYRSATAVITPPASTDTQAAGVEPTLRNLCLNANAQTDAPSVPSHTDKVSLDACGLTCPGPILKLKKAMEQLTPGTVLEVSATDPGFPRDAQAWCDSTGNEYIGLEEQSGLFNVRLRKGQGCAVNPNNTPAHKDNCVEKNKTLILFSDDLDKALATFVLANGAAATGGKVSIFFTFWGLNVLKKTKKPAVKKDIFGRMFGWMLPSSSLHLGLSKMNFCGMGSKLMRHIMRLRNVDALESMRQQALDNGVEFIACQMSMDVMGIHREELIDEVTVGGVATYMNRAEAANVNLFI
jgi:NADPH-dependent 2,4-dienoyl-CoA reductase/sulfur reductase-like enzyme/peroxiredoxin family protein/rhodanese-related sulfurtransferase/TusA-related sulfurtransferase